MTLSKLFALFLATVVSVNAFRSMRMTPAFVKKSSSSSLNANILDTANSNGNFKTLMAVIKQAGLDSILSGPGPFTVFAPTDEAFSKLPNGKVDELLKDPKTLKDLLLLHVHPGKMSPTRNGKTIDTLMMGQKGFPKQLTIKVTNWSCESYIFAGQETPAFVTELDVKCDNGLIHILDEVLLPYEGEFPPQITFIGSRDKDGGKTLQQVCRDNYM